VSSSLYAFALVMQLLLLRILQLIFFVCMVLSRKQCPINDASLVLFSMSDYIP
jgi:hypothetical protein